MQSNDVTMLELLIELTFQIFHYMYLFLKLNYEIRFQDLKKYVMNALCYCEFAYECDGYS